MSRTILVIPCYNEAARLRPDAFATFFRTSKAVDVLFVDDGSRDETLCVLRSICAEFPERAAILQLPANCGKAEAVRQGFLAATGSNAQFVGFWDADLATPLDSIDLFLAEFDRYPVRMIMGSRVQLLGRSIERPALRHYAGRVVASLIGQVLQLRVYDTQCGAKVFLATPILRGLFETPFRSRWLFDVEIIARLQIAHVHLGAPPVETCVRELPLPVWRDVEGSKIRWSDSVGVVRDLCRIYWWRRRAITPVPQLAGANVPTRSEMR